MSSNASFVDNGWFGFPDLDALFRVRAKDNNWIWKPPTLEIGRQEVRLDTAESDADADVIATLVDGLAACKDFQAIQQLFPFAGTLSHEQMRDFSKAAFLRLLDLSLAEVDDSSVWTLGSVGNLYYFLQSDMDVPDARNLTTLMQWLSDKDITRDAFDHFIAIIVDKLHLRTLDVSELPSLLCLMPSIHCSSVFRDDSLVTAFQSLSSHIKAAHYRAADAPAQLMIRMAVVDYFHSIAPTQQSVLQLHAVFRSFAILDDTVMPYVAEYLVDSMQIENEGSHIGKHVRMIDAMLSEPSIYRRQAPWSRHLLLAATSLITRRIKEYHSSSRLLDNWLSILRWSALAQDSDIAKVFWRSIYTDLSASFPPRQLAAHFASFDDARHAARLMLRFWQMPKITQDFTKYMSQTDIDQLGYGDQSTKEKRYLRVVEKAMERRFAHYDAKDKSNPSRYRPFVDALICLHDHKTRADPAMITDIFELLIAYEQPNRVYSAFRVFAAQGYLGNIPEQAGISLIRFFLRTNLSLIHI